MYRFFILCMLCCGYSWSLFAQTGDTTKAQQLEEVVVISQRTAADKSTKPLASLDAYLEKANAINMIRRGSYASEPFLNGMGSERSVITIDGMRIYNACTDKMDPVTSYLEITNLSKASVHSGQSGSFGGSTIAGSLDLVRSKGHFGQKELRGAVFSGFETNNQQKILGSAFAYSRPKVFANIDFTYRDAANYKAGGKEVLYSQFTKYNMSSIVGYKINAHQQVEASFIYDRAVNVGYPALPMDVSLARAFIGSVEYSRHHLSPAVDLWQTKIYYNDVEHVMDDSKRPIVPIRMDMPGWSKTAGFYSRLQGNAGKHNWQANLSGHRNKSLAEMTMFSNDPSQKNMFMLTWPGVLTNYGDIYAEDTYTLSTAWKTVIGAGLGVHNNNVNSQFGLDNLKIFYPDMSKNKTRLLKRLSASFNYEKNVYQYSIGASYGERAPSVSEGYGLYLFNSFDRFDYIGNPDMKNERSLAFNGSMSYNRAHFQAKLAASYFYIANYIIGKPQSGLSTMTMGAAGVKIYGQLPYANLYNTAFDLTYQVNNYWSLKSKFSYRRGTAKNIGNLPLIQPFTYNSGVTYSLKSFSSEATVNGAAKQNKINADFGESSLPAYVIFNVSASNRFLFAQQSILMKAGVENIFDTEYTTFADWNRLPRMGRNFFINLAWNF